MLSSLGTTHHVFPTSTLFFGGRKTLNCLAEKEAEGTAGLCQERRPLRQPWDTCRGRTKSSYRSKTKQLCHYSYKARLSFLLIHTKREEERSSYPKKSIPAFGHGVHEQRLHFGFHCKCLSVGYICLFFLKVYCGNDSFRKQKKEKLCWTCTQGWNGQ